MSPAHTPIAVVGIGGIFPDAPDLDRFWENIAARRCAAREVPAGRWLLSGNDAFDPARPAPDKVYSLKACLVDGFAFDPAGWELEESFLRRLDPVFHLGLHAARAAWRSSRTEGLDRSRVGVVIGNIVLPTDAASALTRELLIPVLSEKVLGRRVEMERRTDPINRYVAGLPAGVIARALGLGGGSFALDAACASSLYALKLACDELRAGRCDAMITGGVSRPESLYTQMGFAQLRALSASGRPAPFDESADGLVVGEGAGMFVLKRLADAERAGDRIYGLIAGVGLSNDVGGSLLAPNTPGQLGAMRRAYQQAGWSPAQVDLIECHSPGTPTGDPVEVASLKALWGERGWTAGQCALGSVKSNVGHLLTAAGAAGLMKVLLAFGRKQLPPSANFQRAAPGTGLEESPFRVQRECADWAPRDDTTPRRAAVSAFGFGGINAHVLVEEYVGAAAGRRPAGRHGAPEQRPAAGCPVAIVGMEARFGACSGLRRFQEAVLGKAELPSAPAPAQERWWGAGIGDFPGHYIREVGVSAFDYRIPPKEMAEMLPQQLLMLDTAAKAVADARLKEFPGGSCGVFIGLGLDLNTTNFDLRWSLLDSARAWAREQGWELSPEEEREFVRRLRDAAGPALSANRTMGALGGIVASRIAREFHAAGPSFTVSGEENSGLRALETAVRALQQGEIDLAISGAVDMAGDLRALTGSHAQRPFSASGSARPFDVRAAGSLPGEGAAALILKRLDDAQRDGDRVYAVVKGVGFASGSGVDRPAPSASAYAAALSRAYADAGVDPSTVGYLETHGSGAPAEDRIEAEALTDFYGTASTDLPCALGSSKPQLGHAGAAAGLAGTVKAALALYQEILPPMRPFAALPELARANKRFHVPVRPQYWLRNRAEGPRRAAVSSMGIDGNCGHVVLEEAVHNADDARTAAERRQPLGARREALFTLEADAPSGLLDAVTGLRSWLGRHEGARNIEYLARAWWADAGRPASGRLALALVARDAEDLLGLLRTAESSLRDNPERPIAGDRIHLTSREPFGPEALAFVFPGSGNQYLGMGLGLGTQWPEILRRQDLENGYLRSQMMPHRFAPWRFSWEDGWEAQAETAVTGDFQAMIFGSVSHAAAVSDLVRSFGVEPRSVIGYSLGETAGLFSLRAWTARDEMLRRMRQSSLFVNDLAGPCEAARRFWNLPSEERMDWVLGVIDRPEESVKMALKGMERAALLIVNAPFECVVGGYRKAVDHLVEGLGCVFLPLQGVSTVHFPAAELVAKQYRELHLLPTSPVPGVRFYSGAWGKSYEVTKDSAADSITTQAIRSLDFPALIKQVYADGARVFVELGPQASCTRMIGKILGPLPYAAKSACVKGAVRREISPDGACGTSDTAGADETGTILRLLAMLTSERMPVDLKTLYGLPSCAADHQPPPEPQPRVHVTLGACAPRPLDWKPARPARPEPAFAVRPETRIPMPEPVLSAESGLTAAASLPEQLLAAEAANFRAHETFLRLSREFAQAQLKNIALQTDILRAAASGGSLRLPAAPPRDEKPLFLDRQQCLEFAVGSIAKVLGAKFAEVDAYPTRVRLPDEPLMLVDRMTSVSGEPGSLRSGRLVTEHDIQPGAWYLDGGRIPTCIAVEAGQADLFLSAYLGIDFQTKGARVYRLLDAEVTFHRGLPGPGEVIRYDIQVDHFSRHNDVWLMFFSFESTVGGEPLLSMRKGCAGFFTAEELAAGKGVVFTADDLKPKPGQRTADWQDLVPLSGKESYDDDQLLALRSGDLAACFGPAFSGLDLRSPMGLPMGRMKLVDRILELDPKGGRFGLGRIRGEADIHPDDWHLTCHFKDDNVMPGTLMYECCMHTLRVLLMRQGWVGEKDRCWFEPVPGVTSGLHCRGQVTARTRKVVYEVAVKEIGYGPQPYVIADALMYADGRPVVRITDICARMGGTDREALRRLWASRAPDAAAAPKRILFDNASIMDFAVGKPSEAFGAPYKIFDSERVIARLPGPPYKVLDRITRIQGVQAFKLAAGGVVDAEYDVPRDAWYFKSNGQPRMPFGVLLEVALQPCGWLAAYAGSALSSPTDLSFRNLGGSAVQYEEIGPDAGTLVATVKMTKNVHSAGMLIQDYDMAVRRQGRLVYAGVTQFGFFSRSALSEQVGVRGAQPYVPDAGETARGSALDISGPGMPRDMLRMLDGIDLYVPDGGPKGLGFIRGHKKVDPAEWFFQAHFYQDPVCPGSLGLESFLQLLKAAARQRWPDAGSRFEAMALGRKHQWVYRGQIVPANKLVTVEACVTAVDDADRMLRADGFLQVDGRVIYKMTDFTLRLI